MNAVYTIGYEGADLGDFVETLRKVDIDLCHRKTVADRFGEILGVDPCHLGVQKSVSKQKATHVRTRQSLPAAESAI